MIVDTQAHGLKTRGLKILSLSHYSGEITKMIYENVAREFHYEVRENLHPEQKAIRISSVLVIANTHESNSITQPSCSGTLVSGNYAAALITKALLPSYHVIFSPEATENSVGS